MTKACQCQFETSCFPATEGPLAGVMHCALCRLPKARVFAPDAFTLGAEFGDKERCAMALGVSVRTLERAYAGNPKLLARVEGQVRGHWPTIVEQYFPKKQGK